MMAGFLSGLTTEWRRRISYLWLMLAVAWGALSINWISVGENAHGALTLTVALACYLFAEKLRDCDCHD